MARVQLSNVTYFGGHPEADKPMKGLVLVIDDDGIQVRRFREIFLIRWTNVASVDFEGPDQVGRRVTMTRMAAMGPLAFAAKKRTSDAYMHVQSRAGYAVGFQVPKTSVGELRAKLGHWITQVAAPPMDAPVVGGVADELAKLGDLRTQGLLSEAEFEAAKARLLH